MRKVIQSIGFLLILSFPLQVFPAVNFLGRDLNNEAVSRLDHNDKAVVVGLWASWCPHCVDELNLLESIQRAYGDDVFVVAVSYDETKRQIQKALKHQIKDLSITLTTDKGLRVRRSLGSPKSVPRMYLLNNDGEIIYRARGYSDCVAEELVGAINQFIEEGKYEQTTEAPCCEDDA